MSDPDHAGFIREALAAAAFASCSGSLLTFEPRPDRGPDCLLPDGRTVCVKVVGDITSDPDELWIDVSRTRAIPDV